MKTKILILITILFISAEIYSQWVQIGPDTNTVVYCLATNGTNIYAGSNVVFTTTNDGINWNYANSFSNPSCIAAFGTYVFVASWTSDFEYSSNSGINFSHFNSGPNEAASLLITQNVVFAGSTIGGSGVYKSNDSGRTWIHNSFSTAVFAMASQSDSVIYAVARWGWVYRSTNFGNNWSYLSTIYSVYETYSLVTKGSYIFAGNEAGNSNLRGFVSVSTDSGISWTQTSLTNTEILSLVTDGMNIFAATERGVYISTDNGITWQQKIEGMGAVWVRGLCILNGYLYAGTYTKGVWKRPISELLGIIEVTNSLPQNFSLSQNYPNPFNPTTKIKFDIPYVGNGRDRSVRVIIYDALGKEVATLVNEQLKPGTYEADWDGTNYPSGIYFYKLETGDPSTSSGRSFIQTKKMLLIK